MIEKGADPAAVTNSKSGSTPLHYAARQGHAAVTEVRMFYNLIVFGVVAVVESRNAGKMFQTEISFVVFQVLIRSFSSKQGSLNSVYPTVEAFVNAQNSNKQTALHLAAFAGHMQVVEVRVYVLN